jgi:hypothetical protein
MRDRVTLVLQNVNIVTEIVVAFSFALAVLVIVLAIA